MNAPYRPLSVHFPAALGDSWKDVLPALNAVDGVELLHASAHAAQPSDFLIAGMGFRVWLRPAGQATEAYAGFRQIFCNIDLADLAVLEIAPGPHLEGGEHLLPVIQAELELGVALGEKLGALALGWAPSQNLVACDFFARTVRDLAAGGPFPVFGLVDIAQRQPNVFATTGLAYLEQCEIELSKPASMSAGEAVKRLIRLVNDVIANGGYAAPQALPGLTEGETLRILAPRPDDGIIRVEIDAG